MKLFFLTNFLVKLKIFLLILKTILLIIIYTVSSNYNKKYFDIEFNNFFKFSHKIQENILKLYIIISDKIYDILTDNDIYKLYDFYHFIFDIYLKKYVYYD